jgi:uncharacterized membrane protein
MTDTSYQTRSEAGRGAAVLAYVLYLLSIPSVGALALVGVIVAYVGRGEAGGAALTHLNHQIRIWWTAFWLTAIVWVMFAVGGVLTVVLIGIPILMLAFLAQFVIAVWFTVASGLGLFALLQGRPR